LVLLGIDGLDYLRVLPESDIQKSLIQQISDRLKTAVEHTIDLQVGGTMDFGGIEDQVQAAEGGTFVARTSAGEFAVVFQPVQSCDPVGLAKAFCRRLSGGFEVYGRSHYIDAYCGVVTDLAGQSSAQVSLGAARIALSRARSKSASDRQALFDESLTEKMKRDVDIESDFQHALETRALQVYYQPIVNAVDEHIVAAEALLRWRHPEHGWINPERMVAIAEARGIMHRLTMHVLSVACEQHAAWKAEGLVVNMSVNVSASEFEHPRFVEHVLDVVDTYGMDAERLQLEITERVVMENPEQAFSIIDRLRQREIRLALDDFGVGYSSLSYLMKLRPDTLKIDRSFVMSAMKDEVAATVLESIVAMALRLGVRLVAEGIETEEDRDYLRRLGAHSLQGYFYGKAVDAASFGENLATDYDARKQKKR
ncbi:MAG: GGDEF domain-containing phosphodiesterase, partial [Myxococcota bacterium]